MNCKILGKFWVKEGKNEDKFEVRFPKHCLNWCYWSGRYILATWKSRFSCVNDSRSISVHCILNDLYYSSFKCPFYSGSISNNNQITAHCKIKAASSQKKTWSALHICWFVVIYNRNKDITFQHFYQEKHNSTRMFNKTTRTHNYPQSTTKTKKKHYSTLIQLSLMRYSLFLSFCFAVSLAEGLRGNDRNQSLSLNHGYYWRACNERKYDTGSCRVHLPGREKSFVYLCWLITI